MVLKEREKKWKPRRWWFWRRRSRCARWLRPSQECERASATPWCLASPVWNTLLFPWTLLFRLGLRIRDILVRIRIHGFGSADPCIWLMDPDSAIFVIVLQDVNKKLVFLLIAFRRYIYIIFSKIKSYRSHKAVGIKVFLTILAWRWKEPDPNPYLWLSYPDPGGQKLWGSYGSGSATLVSSAVLFNF